ncbi:MAG: lipase family protein [bacterium]|nr:lipase family protein [bacterium]
MIYHPQTRMLAEAAWWAYEEPEEIVKGFAAGHALGRFEFFDKNGTQAFVAAGDTRIVVAFRGTEEIADWLADIDAGFTRYAYGRIHRGFSRALLEIWPDLFKTVMDWHMDSMEVRELLVTGHSLGAVLATLAFIGLEASRLVTFGSPRVGDSGFARWFNKTYRGFATRFVNNNDIVPRTPPYLAGYRHVGRLAYITAAGRIKGDATAWFRLKDAAFGFRGDIMLAGVDAIKDHSMTAYASAIQRAYDEGGR